MNGQQTDLVFHLTGHRGLRRVEFWLNAPTAREVHVIGKSRLTVGPEATAVWIFD